MKVNPDGYGRRRKAYHDPRVLHLKIRVVLTAPVTAETARLLVHRAVETGVVPAGIALHWIDWSKEGKSGSMTEGRMTDRLRAALRDFYGAISASATRFERVV